jgi:hypothetical protein
MKFIISEDKIYDLIMKHINSMFDIHNIHWINGIDDWGNEVDYAISFYQGDYDEDDTLFRWYSEDYWTSEEDYLWTDEHIKEMKDKSPILSFEDTNTLNALNGCFGDRWHQPFKDWFMENFKKPIKTIE